MGIGYQAIDRKVNDYDLWFLGEGRLAFRGPRPDLGALGRICFIGAAQTFGRFVELPFPELVARQTGAECVNLGVSGAGPEFYLNKPVLRQLIAEAPVLIVQSMSGRSVSAGVFRAGGNNGVLEFQRGPLQGQSMLAQQAYAALRRDDGEAGFTRQVAAAQHSWVELHRELITFARGRVLFLWLSERSRTDPVDLSTSPVGVFPHFVTGEMVAEAGFAEEAVIDASLPLIAQPLINDTDGRLETVFDAARFPARPDALRSLNTYYATPAAHYRAAGKIIAKLAELGLFR